MAKSRKNAQRKRAEKAANAANMEFLEEETEPQPGPSTKKPRISKKIKPLLLDQTLTDDELDQERSSKTQSDFLPNDDETVVDTSEQENGGSGSGATNHELHGGTDNSEVSHEQCEAKIAMLEKLNAELTEKNSKLNDKITNLSNQNWKLQCKLVEDNKKILFNVRRKEGYPSSEWLLKASQIARDSDYLFVKELVMYLWPGGIGQGTASGRISNNPKGNKKLSAENMETTGAPSSSSPINSTGSLTKLDPEKIKYIKDCLIQRREILGDDYGLASELARKTIQHINRVRANNPSLKSVNG